MDFFRRFRIVPMFLIILSLTTPVLSAEQKTSYKVEDLELKELNKMEQRANHARRLFWQGESGAALSIFKELASSKHPSTPLYYNEMALCYIAEGDYDSAKKKLLDVNQFFDFYNTEKREKEALSVFGKESEKIYNGDPYERAVNWFLLALIFLEDGENDNALAACKSGLLADSDARNNTYESNFTMLYLLEAKIYKMRGQEELARQVYEKAKESYIYSHPLVRDLYSERMDNIAIQKLSDKEKKKLKITKTNEQFELDNSWLIEKIKIQSREIDVVKELGRLLTGEFNTLIISPVGKGPTKNRRGEDANYVFFETNDVKYQPAEIFLDDQSVTEKAFTKVADVNYHATTRGGRQMDAILEGKAVSRKTTIGVGQFVTELGNNVGGYVGLALVLTGVVAQGVGGSMTPDADTRCWQQLPASYYVHALDIPPGEHKIIFRQRVYFENKRELQRTLTIRDDPERINVVIGPHTVSGVYSKNLSANTGKAKRRKSKKKQGHEIAVLITPPLGFKSIERFPALMDKEEPRAFAPDLKKLLRRVEKRLSKANINSLCVGHEKIIDSLDTLKDKAPLALQIQLMELKLKKVEKDELYKVSLSFSLVDTDTGEAKFKKDFTGEYLKAKKDKTSTTKAFYKCFNDAVQKFLTSDGMTTVIDSST